MTYAGALFFVVQMEIPEMARAWLSGNIERNAGMSRRLPKECAVSVIESTQEPGWCFISAQSKYLPSPP